MAKQNYRMAKKQKEEARKARQSEKRQKKQRPDGEESVPADEVTETPVNSAQV